MDQTANYKDFKCYWCGEGSDRYAFDVTVVIILIVILFSFSLIVFIRRKVKINKQAIVEMKISKFEKAAIKRQQNELHRLLPLLEQIDRRLGDKYTVQLNPNGKLVDFDPDYLFDAIDKDHNNILTYTELDEAMGLTEKQLLAFIKMMNDADDSLTCDEKDVVSRVTFVNNFFTVIKRVAYFDPTPDEVDGLFEEISDLRPDSAVISLYDLKYSSVVNFLNDKDIQRLEVFFKNKIAEKLETNIRVLEFEDGIVIQHSTPSVDVESSEKISTPSNSSTKFAKLKADSIVSQTEFKDWFPEALQSLVRYNETLLEPIDIYFKNLSLDVEVKNGTTRIVNDITGRIEVGRMTAVMGKSFF